MKKKFLSLILLTTLALSICAALPVSASSHEKPKIVAHLKGAMEADIQLQAIMGNITDVQWEVVLGDVNPAVLSGAKMLIMSKADSSLEYTQAELLDIATWFDEGGKVLWVAADSDYGSDHMRQLTANQVLEAVGSSLRFDDASAEDPVSNADAPYRVLGVSDNCAEELEFLVYTVERALFHGPAIVVVKVGGSLKTLDEAALDNVYAIMTTSDTGVIVDNSEPAPEALEAGDEGNFPLMVMEIDYAKKNIVIATGEAPFDQYAGMYAPELRRYDRYAIDNPQQGAQLFENIINFATDYADEFMESHVQISSLEGAVSGLTSEVAGLEDEVGDLEDEVEDLEDDKATLESEVSSLEADVASLEGDLASAKSSASTMQMAAIAALIIGVIIGYFVGPMLKKS